jgi:hypothetical protein
VQTVLTKYVWIERAMVFIASLASSVSWVQSSNVTTVAAGGIAGAVAFSQVVAAILTHTRGVVRAVDTAVTNAANTTMTIRTVPSSMPVPTTVPVTTTSVAPTPTQVTSVAPDAVK